MFRIAEVFIDDKKLVAFLKAAAGLVHSMSPPEPVVNVVENGSLQAASNGTVPDVIFAEYKKQKLQSFTVQDIKKSLEAMGRSPLSSHYVLKHLKADKRIKMTQRGLYEVLK